MSAELRKFEVYVPQGYDEGYKVVTVNAATYGWDANYLTFFKSGSKVASFREWVFVSEVES
jgi:hypothetical protein